MAEIPGYGTDFFFGDQLAAKRDWRKEATDSEDTDDDSDDSDAKLTPEERRALVAQLGFDPAEDLK